MATFQCCVIQSHKSTTKRITSLACFVHHTYRPERKKGGSVRLNVCPGFREYSVDGLSLKDNFALSYDMLKYSQIYVGISAFNCNTQFTIGVYKEETFILESI